MKKLIFALIVVCLLASVGWAESSWVLWSHDEYVERNLTIHVYWKILDAYPLYKTCQEARARVWLAKVKGAKEDKAKYDTIEVVDTWPYYVGTRFKVNDSKEGIYSTSQELICLPETVNPHTYEQRKD